LSSSVFQSTTLIAPTVYVALDQTKYQPVYDACMAGASPSALQCQITAQNAVTADAQQRFVRAFAAMRASLGTTADQILTSNNVIVGAQ
jgi:hypothetical protein